MGAKGHRALTCLVALAVLSGGVAAALGEILFSDNFEGAFRRPEGWLILNAPSEAFWVIEDGEFVTGNGDNISKGGGYSYAILTAPGSDEWENYTVSADVWMSQYNGRIALVGRWNNRKEHIEGMIEFDQGRRTARIVRVSYGLTGGISDRVAIAETSGSASNSIPAMEGGLNVLDGRRLSLSFQDSEVTLAIDGVVLLTVMDTQLRRGTAGIANFQNFAYYDNFKVEVASSSGTGVKTPPFGSPGGATPSAIPGVPNISVRLPEGTGATFRVAWNNNKKPLEGALVSVRQQAGPNAPRIEGTTDRNGMLKLDLPTGWRSVMVQATHPEIQKIESRAVLPAPGPIELSARRSQESRNALLTERAEREARVSAPVRTGTGSVPGILSPLPIDIAEGLDFKTLESRLTPNERRAYEQMSEGDKTDLLRSIAMSMKASSGPSQTELTNELAQLKRDMQKQYDDLSSEQKKIADSLTKKLAEEQAIAEGIRSIEELQDLRQYDQAIATVDDLLKNYPLNAAVVTKKNMLAELAQGQFPGWAERLEANEQRFAQLKAQAEKEEAEGDYHSALSTWKAIQALEPSKAEWITQSSGKIGTLRGLTGQERESIQDRLGRASGTWFIAVAAASVSGLVIVAFIFLMVRFQKRAKARDREILLQVKDLTKPMVDMQEEIRHLTGGGSGLALPSASSGADRPRPARRPAPAPSRSTLASEPTEEQGVADMETELTGPLPTVSSDSFDELLSSGDDLFASDDSTSVAPPAAPEPVEDFGSDSGLDLEAGGSDDLPSLDVAGDDDGLGLDLDAPLDLGSEEPPISLEPPIATAARPVEVKAPRAPAPRNESLDLGLDLESEPKGQGEDIDLPPLDLDSAGESDLDAGDDALDFPDLTIDGDDEDTDMSGLDKAPGAGKVDLEDTKEFKIEETKASIPKIQHKAPGLGGPGRISIPKAAPAAVAPAGGARAADTSVDGLILEQDFEDQEAGQAPAHWTGLAKECAVFEVCEATSKKGPGKCLRLAKSAGADSVHFSRRFPETSGVVTVEFDICCPEKNKYLLGLYLEKDGNYNQAVRTVVHCLDPSSASLRMQNEPTPYKMGDWRHVRYIVNLPEGLIDGFVDGDQILDQQVFVNKPPYLNTLSIRDNHATTGELLIDNIRITRKG